MPMYKFKVPKTFIDIENNIITIQRKGLLNFATQGLKGDKSIPFRNITAIQIKKPGLTNGYIQFSQHGMLESKKGLLDANADENTVTLVSKTEYEQALEIKELIENANNNDSTQQVHTHDVAEEIRKFKALLDDGILTQEEFDAKKKEFLGM